MLSSSHRDISNQPETGLQTEYPSAMNHRMFQVCVSILTTHKQIEVVTIDPALSLHIRQSNPRERTFWLRLIQPINLQSVVGSGAAKLIAARVASHIFECPGIDEQRAPLAIHADAECVGVSVASSNCPVMSGVHDELIPRFRTRHQVDAASRQRN